MNAQTLKIVSRAITMRDTLGIARAAGFLKNKGVPVEYAAKLLAAK